MDDLHAVHDDRSGPPYGAAGEAGLSIVLSITFILLWIGAGFGVPSMIQFGGYAGILTAALAFYASWKAVHYAHPSLPV